ncbi:hypothetical protein N7509_002592 [Penicillium cosmopolitanum]|uniref:RING-type domain-containing protein n=1 Tax=Penicillium cosmopolitanum TaxID=1131564 RepID=A0A9W9W9E3_9EURO|nr:uncharacterized protein N7509_002592 [Penicillium cosmopolitanum]KAJ5408709.1 hypothetical protein N7509_002592 [Penicillium cosmopolitanum]
MLVNTLQGHVDDIRSQLQCGICIRPLYEPFTLACGHTFCYSCLDSWFAGGKSKRTCPDCRAPVKTQPAPAYLVRTVVQMFTSRAELLDKGETTADHLSHREEESGRLDKDKANTDPQHGGLFRGLFKEKVQIPPPVADLDDGVMRCPICSWELGEDESCAGCGYTYPENDEADDDGFGDIEDDDPVWGGFALPGSFPRDLGAAPPAGISWHDGLPPFYQPGAPWPPRGYEHAPLPPLPPPPGVILTDPSEYDEHYIDEENEYDEQDSFIDNEEHMDREDDDSQSEHSTVMESGDGWQAGNSRRPIVLDETILSDDEEEEDDDDDDEDEDEEGSVARRPPRRLIGTFSSDDDEEEEEEEEEDDMDEDESSLVGPGGPWGIPASHGDSYHDAPSSPTHTEETDDGENPELDLAPGRRYLQNVVEDSEESESSDPSSPPPRRHTRPVGSTGVTFGNAITIDDSEEEQPVGPVRRQVQRRQPRYSPY